MFSKPNVAKHFEPYIVVQLYTDTVPKEYYAPEIRTELARDGSRLELDAKQINVAFQRKVFGTEELPLYVILEPLENGRVQALAAFQGRVFDEQKFVDFLVNPKKN